MTEKALMVMDEIPEPMTPLTMEVIHPDNIAFEIEVRRARVLSRTNIASLKWQRLILSKQVNLDEYIHLRDEASKAKKVIREAKDLYTIARDEAKEKQDEATFKKLDRRARDMLKTYLEPHKATYSRAIHIIRPIQSQAEKLLRIERTIEAYETAKRQEELEKEAHTKLYHEAKIYSSFIKQEWAARDDCHATEYKGENAKKTIPQFDTVDITATRIYFKILTSFKGWFEFRRALPGSVSISSLIAPDVLLNIQSAIGRPVTSIVKPNGVWVVVDRLGSVGGLPEFVEYDRMMDFYPEFLRDKIPLCLGVTENAQIVYLTLDDYPHFLIAGFTGAGKSNIVNVLISTLISKHSPDELGLVLIDMKGGLEFNHYDGLPHLIGDIVEDITAAADLLAKLEAEMHHRFELLRKKKAKKIDIYNARVDEEKRLPRLCVFFDEMATLAGQGETTKRIIASLRELSAKGRAIGIHVFCCTQHPSVSVIPGEIKTNLTVRMTGRMPTASSSLTVLGSGDAAKIEDIKGRMMLAISPDPKPIQTPFISDDAIARALKQAAKREQTGYSLPDVARTDVYWTPQKVIELSLKHLGGNITYSKIYKAVDDLSQKQTRDLCEEIWHMENIESDGIKYSIEKRERGARYLVPI